MGSDSVKKIIFLDTVDSTNTYLKTLALKGAEAGTAVIAARQTAGRGRTGNSFVSEEGGLYLSVLLDTSSMELPETTALTSRAAVAAVRALREAAGIDTGIKWVNDLILNGGKLGGILVEAGRITEGRIPYVVAGVGINLNQTSFPESISGTAVSLRMAAGRQFSRENVAEALLGKLRQLGEKGMVSELEDLKEYREVCVTAGRTVTFERNGCRRTALAKEITEDYGLRVEYEDHTEEILRSGEVHVRGIAGYV